MTGKEGSREKSRLSLTMEDERVKESEVADVIRCPLLVVIAAVTP